MGSKVYIYGPATFIPKSLSSLGAIICTSMEEALRDADVVMTLRIQKERQDDPLLPSFREYSKLYGINRQRASLAKPDAIIMHPGPINRGIELMPDVADSPQSVILDQVTNGVAVRMALLYLVIGAS